MCKLIITLCAAEQLLRTLVQSSISLWLIIGQVCSPWLNLSLKCVLHLSQKKFVTTSWWLLWAVSCHFRSCIFANLLSHFGQLYGFSLCAFSWSIQSFSYLNLLLHFCTYIVFLHLELPLWAWPVSELQLCETFHGPKFMLPWISSHNVCKTCLGC